ncbi:MAG: hypothetical protein JWN25_1523 [Verrucomicrobiales bacterium]|nr:hypothetical protein [Verrucomicrobiales bacterium]
MHLFQESTRRILGAVLLTLSGLQVVGGLTFLETFLRRTSPIVYILYWIVCFGFTGLALMIALLDAMLVRRESSDQHKKLIEDTLRLVEKEKERIRREEEQSEKAAGQ